MPELNSKLRKHKVRVVFVDLRWGLTEEGGVQLGALEVLRVAAAASGMPE
jgi:hypothetical protein